MDFSICDMSMLAKEGNVVNRMQWNLTKSIYFHVIWYLPLGPCNLVILIMIGSAGGCGRGGGAGTDACSGIQPGIIRLDDALVLTASIIF